MTLVKWTVVGLLLLPIAEFAVFAIVAAAIGWLWAAGLGLATSLLGLWVLKRTGRRDFDTLRTGLLRDGFAAVRLDAPGAGPLLGGILLLLPGFITDVAGGLLLLPAARRWLAKRKAGADTPRASGRRPQIDLAPGEWERISETKRADRKRRTR